MVLPYLPDALSYYFFIIRVFWTNKMSMAYLVHGL